MIYVLIYLLIGVFYIGLGIPKAAKTMAEKYPEDKVRAVFVTIIVCLIVVAVWPIVMIWPKRSIERKNYGRCCK